MIICEKMHAKLSQRACLINQKRSIDNSQRGLMTRNLFLDHCMTCERFVFEEELIKMRTYDPIYGTNPLREWKISHGMTWNQVAEYTGISKTSLMGYMSGRNHSETLKQRLESAGVLDG